MKNSNIYYNVGPLLYCPASSQTIAHSIVTEQFGHHFSLALCLEDTIADDFILEAENQLIHSLHIIKTALSEANFYLPQIFIRVRDSLQISRLFQKLGSASDLLTGFILPKFSLSNADAYLNAFQKLDSECKNLYLMPVIESPSIVNLKTRSQILYTLKEKLEDIEEKILNIRVGGNDLCNVFGLRRQVCESIYDLRPIADILSDIMTVFGQDYVLSGPVWEYYNGTNWKNGLSEELSKDKTFGFVGKTVIHPKQITLVNQAFSVSLEDYQDALEILNWNPGHANLVSGSHRNIRMNEYKTHYNWALRTKYLADSYGICSAVQKACH
ncbi:putative uncharacterized protein [Blautia hydrogenotrophica CAG:147]|mgnify:FL=1|uniref:HpcH/HpaI aldolase/citrate lyase family protein n=1 Tax=Blautia hydrogenotrophica TaxID=53443 RepID=UPI00033ED688|nr:HpcH/HpaI aldolase/citrate lyase family protein [Blautia hydrogenotrophica]MEE0463711.1 HpcH/HpaI aldolase/citrate lyase family protein [Blautia hydrogenotrophica]CCX59712.1 putative uncharacterized protein [Blautia hydrogenotrophica CAG:147]CUM98077.1 Citrate lyase beta subunit [Blautia hydrogenotrophica]SCH88780.1 Citrate lyase beta subunit [uncultured Blautia sp.]